MITPKVNSVLIKKKQRYMDNQWNHTFTDNKQYTVRTITDRCIFLNDDKGGSRWFYIIEDCGEPRWYDYFDTPSKIRNQKIKKILK